MSFNHQTPGVYREDIFPAPAAALPTAVPVFLGYTRSWPTDPALPPESGAARMLTLWPQFAAKFGDPVEDGYLAYAVRGFFANGGQTCYVARLDENLDVEAALGRALDAIASLDAIDLVCAPDMMRPRRLASTPGQLLAPERDTVQRMQSALLEHCDRLGDRFAIFDARPTWWDAEPGDPQQQVMRQRDGLTGTNGALYYPWLVTFAIDPAAAALTGSGAGSAGSEMPGGSRGRSVRVPPCGHLAGIYARSDQRVGVHKAPANEALVDLVDLVDDLSDAQQGPLNQAHINCLRGFPGRGLRVWGARTLSTDPAWQYVNVRRVFVTAARWIERNMAGTSFEPNGLRLWARITRELTGYFTGLHRRGALQGRTPKEAFYIKCDADTNPAELRDAGIVVTEIGLALAQPYEFVVVRIMHGAAGVQITGPVPASA